MEPILLQTIPVFEGESQAIGSPNHLLTVPVPCMCPSSRLQPTAPRSRRHGPPTVGLVQVPAAHVEELDAAEATQGASGAGGAAAAHLHLAAGADPLAGRCHRLHGANTLHPHHSG